MSNKLSKRRAVHQHPKICVAAGCPPPPPPSTWPPGTFTLTFEYEYDLWGEPTMGGFSVLCEQTPPWDWIGIETGGDSGTAEWYVDELAHEATLVISGYNDPVGEWYMLTADPVAVTWGISTPYMITEWDELPWWMYWAHASFTF